MNVLEMYIQQVDTRRGIPRARQLRNLRRYLNETKIEPLIAQIGEVVRMEYLKILWEAGLNKFLQPEVERRQQELYERRRERLPE